MSELILTRDSYAPSFTMGELWDGEDIYHTIERPWIRGPNPGGMSFESCIPDGRYELVPHTRPSGDKVVALVNPELGVWYQKADRPDVWGRYLVLIHTGNFSHDVVGCIAPGLGRTIHNNAPMVTSSRAAMGKVNVQGFTSILIKPSEGARDA